MLSVDVPSDYVGVVMEKLGRRKAEMINMSPDERGGVRIEFKIPSRGLMGYRSELLVDTKGYGNMNHLFLCYEPYKGDINNRQRGSIIAWATGETTTYGLYNAQERGRLFIGAGVQVYEGVIVGENAKAEDLVVNVCKKKHVTNIRAASSDEALRLITPAVLSLEQCMEFIAEDEYVEVTPKNIRMRKKILSRTARSK
jgi:GTP-binding protein